MNRLGLIIMSVQFTSDNDGFYATCIGRESQTGHIIILRIDHKTLAIAVYV